MIRAIDDDGFTLFQSWCEGHNWPAAPRALFPARGFFACRDDTPIIGGWLYRDPSCAYSMLEYVVADPQSTSEQRGEAFTELAEHIFAVAKADGAQIMHMAIDSGKTTFGKRLESVGFHKTDEHVTLYMKALV